MSFRSVLAVYLSLISACAICADREVERLLAKMREAYRTTKTAHVVVKTTARRFGSQAVTTDLTFKREQKIAAKVYNLPSLKGKVWNYVCDGKQVSLDDLGGNVQRTKFDPDFIPMPINLEAMSFWDWKRQLSTGKGSNMEFSTFKLFTNVPWNNKKWTVLEETANAQKVFARYYIDQKSNLIYRVQVFDIEGRQQRLETTVAKIELNLSVNDKVFRLREPSKSPPKRIE
jgi:outer membrane lipoprotein-sorting protein